jgi:hypothetical protein
LGEDACSLVFDASAGTGQDQNADVTAVSGRDKDAFPGMVQLVLSNVHVFPQLDASRSKNVVAASQTQAEVQGQKQGLPRLARLAFSRCRQSSGI